MDTYLPDTNWHVELFLHLVCKGMQRLGVIPSSYGANKLDFIWMKAASKIRREKILNGHLE